ncbi:telomerase inhibitor [Rhizina undulata]
MGLAGPRNRTKIGADPRNTKWANDNGRFGHKLLTEMGWKPGSTLGDPNSAYHQAGHITAASSSGVKIVLKDDNLGIGCKRGVQADECTGLDTFQNLLGRLNGKDAEKEEAARERTRREIIVGERYGMRFVRGEPYISSDIEVLMAQLKVQKEKKEAEESGKGKESKKRKRGESEDGEKKQKRKEKRKKSKDSEEEQDTAATPDDSETSETFVSSNTTLETETESKSKSKKEKKSKKSKSRSASTTDGEQESTSDSKKRKRKEKAEKEKKSKKDKKSKEKKRKSSKTDTSSNSSGSEDESEAVAPAPRVAAVTVLTGRHAIRQRYIAAKRSAVMDAQALNEIFMIKA